jgi:hypothetical protein
MKIFANIVTEDGTLLDRIEITDYDLSKPLGRSQLVNDIAQNIPNPPELKKTYES